MVNYRWWLFICKPKKQKKTSLTFEKSFWKHAQQWLSPSRTSVPMSKTWVQAQSMSQPSQLLCGSVVRNVIFQCFGSTNIILLLRQKSTYENRNWPKRTVCNILGESRFPLRWSVTCRRWFLTVLITSSWQTIEKVMCSSAQHFRLITSYYETFLTNGTGCLFSSTTFKIKRLVKWDAEWNWVPLLRNQTLWTHKISLVDFFFLE